MASGSEGFASLEEAADAIAAYNPHRPRPSNLEGLKKNLRLRDDGRWHWHYDPRFINAVRIPKEMASVPGGPAAEAARKIGGFGTPTLLVRGKMSDIVDPEHVEELLEMIPHAESVDVSGAGHMVAGDSNDLFNDSIIDFLNRNLKG
jgi:pimeloyl-ACP methyl ester carboxylesterase